MTTLPRTEPQCQPAARDASAPDAADALREARAARAAALDALRVRTLDQLRRASADYLLLADCANSDPMITYYLARRAECDALADALVRVGGAA